MRRDKVKEEEGTSYEISYHDFLENVFQNTPGNSLCMQSMVQIRCRPHGACQPL